MLTIKNLAVAYKKETVLEDLSLSLKPDQLHGIIGLNGSGKTTLFNAIYGYLKVKNGEILLDGQPVNRKQISILETQNYFYSNITGNEYLNLFPAGTGKFNLSAWELLFKLPLNDIVDTYSTGMKKKLALLGILKLDKVIWLLDEPFNGIDIETSKIIQLLLEKVKRKKTILVTSHILESLVSICDQIHHLENKKFLRSYSPDEYPLLDKDVFGEIEKESSGLLDEALGT